MTISKKRSAAEVLTRHINSTRAKPGQAITDEFAQAVARRLEQRSIAKVPGLPDEPEPEWHELAIRNLEEAQEAQRQVKQRESSDSMPLNGTHVLAAALAGGDGSVYGQARESVAGLIRRGLLESVQDGRSE